MKTKADLLMVLVLITTTPLLTNCGLSTSNPNDTTSSAAAVSASEVAAGAVGGALSDSSANGTQASMSFKTQRSFFTSLKSAINPLPNAMAEAICPTARQPENACLASGSSMFLTYDSCTFAGAAAWTGVQSLTMSSGSASCGTFPNPGANGTLYRQYVQSSNTSLPGQVDLVASNTTGIVDDASSNLSNFDGDSLTAVNTNGGYGAAVSFGANGARDSISIGHHISVQGEFDHSVVGTLNVTETPGATSRTVSGSVKVYHNLLRIVGTSTFSAVVHEDICCLPVSGSITTTFEEGLNVAPTAAGLRAIGKTETLTFTGCGGGGGGGTANLQSYDGSNVSITLNRCF